MMIQNQRVYDILKFIAQILLPAMGTLYFSLAETWGLPRADEVVRTIMAVDLFLGAILGISSIQYNRSDAKFDGAVAVVGDSSVKLNVDVRDLLDKEQVLLRVDTPREDLEDG